MAVKLVRAPNNIALIGGGIGLLLLAALGARTAVVNADHYRLPRAVLVEPAIRDAILGAALLFVALRKSRFAGTTAVIVGTLLTFVAIAPAIIHLVAFASVRVTWWDAIYLAIAAGVVGSSLLPWTGTDNRPAFFWMGLTLVAATFLLGSAALLARL